MNPGSDDPSIAPTPDSPILGRLGRLTLKELREILRDRRTIVTLVLMPLLVYPLLSIGFRQFFLTRLPSQRPIINVGFASDAEGQWFRSFLQRNDVQPETIVDPPQGQSPPEITYYSFDSFEKLEAAVRDGTLDLGIRIRGLEDNEDGPRRLTLDAEFLFVEGYAPGQRALERFQHAVAKANTQFLQRRLDRLGIPLSAERLKVQPLEIKSDQLASGVSLLSVLPLILILMTITGAVYPAIDLTAGERERGTLEILVAAPVPRLGLLLAKYVSVLTVALLTATVNLATMSATILLSGLGGELFGQRGLSLSVVLEIFGLLVLFAALFSAVLLLLSSFARSFKEAQAYLIPLMLLALGPGLLSLTPGLELRGFLAVAPLVNVVLLGRDLLEQNAQAPLAAVVVASNFLYAGAAIAAAARVFGSEDVLFGVQGGWSDWLQRPRRPRPAPSVATALFCLALIFPAFFVVTSGLAPASGERLDVQMLLAGVSTVVLFAGFPLAAAWFRRDPPKTAFQLHRPPLATLPGAVLLGISLWPWAHEVVLLQHELGLARLNEPLLEKAHELLERARAELSLLPMFLTMALLPGVCEEFFFRGYLFKALRAQWRGWATVLCTALLFGGFHLVTTDALAVQRLLPSTMLGLVLGWVCLRSGSVLPGMLLHVCHNGLLVCLAWYQPWLSQQGWAVQEQSHLPVSWLAASAIAILVGAGIIAWSTRSARPPNG